MESYIKTPQSTIRYRISGSGPAIVLLHGYLEDLTIWDELTVELENDHTVLSIDLPGHGKSDCNMDTISMDFMADAVRAVMHYEQIDKTFLLGHSMGGYVSLAFAERYPNTLTGLCLLHSTPNADTEEKRAARMADIQLVKEGKKEQIVQSNIPRLFANQNLEKFSGEIEHIKTIARSTSDSGIIGALNGMAQRPDRNQVLAQAKYPVNMIFGKFDNLIPIEVVQLLQERHKKARTVILNNSGHMGFIEEPDNTAKAIRSILP
ncbi:MAG: hypothetical protein PWR03_530 [Tenuifilum sp.]|jgi:pimeloyl-ACP methyl ester carboxylesterase|uniref:alpha/beta fold hydrolase n=1 Tax=Tenuifilum sp. TaxID=2760880 RepID=UPI0024AA1C44|nr:alpha/beta hydrolase [Tenuifilum sp.]MDI3526347.1 hypothetical protein [Tenuifilum sp.]